MIKKQILQELCSSLENRLNERIDCKEEHKVKFFSGLKPTSYHVPQVFNTPEETARRQTTSWYVEIWVDGRCVFREYSSKGDQEDRLIDKLFESVFFHGVMSSKQFLDELDRKTLS